VPGNELSIKFGKRIRQLRKAQGYSQEEFADIVGVHRTYMGSIERGEKNITIATAKKISEGLKIPLSNIFKGL